MWIVSKDTRKWSTVASAVERSPTVDCDWQMEAFDAALAKAVQKELAYPVNFVKHNIPRFKFSNVVRCSDPQLAGYMTILENGVSQQWDVWLGCDKIRLILQPPIGPAFFSSPSAAKDMKNCGHPSDRALYWAWRCLTEHKILT